MIVIDRDIGIKRVTHVHNIGDRLREIVNERASFVNLPFAVI